MTLRLFMPLPTGHFFQTEWLNAILQTLAPEE